MVLWNVDTKEGILSVIKLIYKINLYLLKMKWNVKNKVKWIEKLIVDE